MSREMYDGEFDAVEAIRRGNHIAEMALNQAACKRPALPRAQTRLEDVAAASANKPLEACSLMELAARLTITAARLAELMEHKP